MIRFRRPSNSKLTALDHANCEDASACLRRYVGVRGLLRHRIHGRVVSNVTLDELALAPDLVRAVLSDLPPQQVEIVSTSYGLRDANLDAGVVGPASSNDAAHIAVATISNVDLVVSWNFKHIVHFEKIGGYEAVNSLRGYRSPRIY